MNYFESIGSSHEYLGWLLEAIAETIADVEEQIKTADGRTLEALELVLYKLAVGQRHISQATKTLHDLHRLKNILLPGEYDGWGY